MSKDDNLQVPPYDIEAEQSVIGAILLDEEALLAVSDILSPNDFYRDEHRYIAKAVFDLANERKPVDIVSVADKLRGEGKLELVGGITYLARLADSVPNTANADYYARIVKEKSVLRNLIRLGGEISTRAFNEDPQKVLAFAEKVIFDIMNAQTTDILHIGEPLSNAIERLRSKEANGLKTGFPTLDRYIDLANGSLNIIAARPGTGKTTLATNIAVKIASRKTPVLIVSMEMNKDELTDRMLASYAKVDSQRMARRYLAEEEMEKVVEAGAELYEMPIYILDNPGLSVERLWSKVRKAVIENKIGIVIIDYLQLLRSEQRYSSRVMEITEISNTLKLMARNLNIPFLVLSQLSREVEKREDKEPRLSDLRESGSIEQDADTVTFLYYESKEDAEEGNIKIKVAKNRNGITGTGHLLFLKEFLLFAERSDK